ncbi:hypothetical protein [Thermodesulforhabdus norvegica]|uniref:DUF4352 domain-containing protein n=1 Tax=Thermodesulforhabdus norvegica TaxID=39841 RepID=A0A1I4ULC2_9BACT|nr:hypothetical protein [Thermodesulforhabdus norvegica]SFM89540.1 hypothetical protein SAMN05660836_01852 [Thermodesulforhabdus norvegica]
MSRKFSPTGTVSGPTRLLKGIILLACLICLLEEGPKTYAATIGESGEKCALEENLLFCATYYGTVPVKSLIPDEESPFFMDIFKIRLENRGTEEISVKPDDFYCITLSGRALVVDRPLHDRIVWQEKLTDYRLLPGESVEKFIFFPSSRDYIRVIVHRVKPIIELRLF